MTTARDLRVAYEANIACGDISKAAEARMLAEIAAAEIDEARAYLSHVCGQRAA